MVKFMYRYIFLAFSTCLNLSLRLLFPIAIDTVVALVSRTPTDENSRLPKGFLYMKDLVDSNGYHYQNYTAVTADGHILQLHRILVKWVNAENPGFPVLVMHGLMVSSDSWLQQEKESLPFLLADQGYDVWLGDLRGNYYSKGHVYYNVTDPRFWNFSFHESGIYDVPAFIDFVLAKNGRSQLFYIGHSMGTTILFTLLSMRPEYNGKIKAAILLAPVATVRSISELNSLALKLGVKSADAFYETCTKNKIYELASRKKELIKTVKQFCSERSPTQGLCLDAFGVTLAENIQNMNKSTIGEQLSSLAAGSSSNTLHHLSQLYKTGFRPYDRREDINLRLYGSRFPPLYPLEKVTAPMALFYSLNDVFINHKSVEELGRALYHPLFIYELEDPKFSHLDYLIGINAKHFVHDKVIATLSSLHYHRGYDSKKTKSPDSQFYKNKINKRMTIFSF